MRKQLIKTIAFCAACGLITAQAQTSGSSSSGSSSGSATDPSSSQSGSSYGSQSGTSGSQSGISGSQSQSGSTGLSATGRSQQQASVRASDLMDANIVSQQGSTIGSVSDVIINPQSGRVDFAIIELSSSSGATGGGLLSSDKQVPVPWSMLKPQSATTSTAGTTTSASSQKSFVFSGDQSKLQNAPAFDEDRWQTQNTSEWRQSVYTHFGVQPGSATGGATSPGGSTYPGSGTSGSSSGGSLDESSSSSGAGQSGSSSGSSGSSTPPGSSSSGSGQSSSGSSGK